MYLKHIILNASTHINTIKGSPQTKCGFHLQFGDYTYNLRIPLTVADSATAQFNDTNVLSFVCGFLKLRISLTICGFHLQFGDYT